MHDVIIVGGSFAGLAAALQLVRARRKVLVLDAGAPRNRNAEHSHGFLTRDGVSPAELLASARVEVGRYAAFQLEQQVARDARRIDGAFNVTCDGGAQFQARRLILAYGVVDQTDDLPGYEECWGRSVFHCPYCHAYEVADKRLGLIVRHGDHARLARLYRDWTHDLTLFTGVPIDPRVRDEVLELGVKVSEGAFIRLDHEGGYLSSFITADATIPIDALFAHPPHEFSSPLGEDLGCETTVFSDGSRILTVDTLHQTSVDGVFAAGDIARPVHSISAAVGDGASAGINCHQSFSFD